MDNEEFRTPGQLLNSLIESKGWSQRTLAIVLGMDETGINRILADKRPVTAELAVLFQEIFDVPAEQFLELQKSYDLARARYKIIPDTGRNLRAHLFGGLPVTEMMKRGWIHVDDIRNIAKVESELTKFFEVSAPDEIETLPHAAKKTAVASAVTPAQLAWLYRVKRITKDLIIPKYSQSSVKKAILKLKELRSSQQEIRKVPRILMESGIRYVIVESPSSSKVDGVCLWLDNDKPIVAMSLRHDRIDNFWFVLRHELEHVRKEHGRSAIMLDTEVEENINDTTSEEERIANNAATDFCVPTKLMDMFMERKFPLITELDMLGFAKSLNVHPGLVVGQIHHHTGRYELFREYLVRIRSIVAPSAIVDGWGDIAPIGT